MTKRLAKLEKYLLVNEKYYAKFRELGTKYAKDVCKAIGAEYIGYYTDILYQHIKYKGIEFQAGGFDPYFYNGGCDNLKEVLEKEIIDATKSVSARCKQTSKKEK